MEAVCVWEEVMNGCYSNLRFESLLCHIIWTELYLNNSDIFHDIFELVQDMRSYGYGIG
jgi:hypothetical protein